MTLQLKMSSDTEAEIKQTEAFDFSKYMLKVKFEINEVEHGGWCSDPYDIETSTKYEFDIYDVPDKCKDLHLFDSHYQLINVHLLSELDSSEPHGNGYCDLESTRNVISAKLIPRPKIKSQSNK